MSWFKYADHKIISLSLSLVVVVDRGAGFSQSFTYEGINTSDECADDESTKSQRYGVKATLQLQQSNRQSARIGVGEIH